MPIGGEADGRVVAEDGAYMAQTPNDPGLAEIKFLTVSEVAALMRVSRMTVYRLVHSEALPAVRVGRSFRVSERAVNEYLQRGFNATG